MSEFISAPRGAYVMSYEEVPAEDLWMDGELRRVDVISRIMRKVLDEGDWILLRKTDRHLDLLQKKGDK